MRIVGVLIVWVAMALPLPSYAPVNGPRLYVQNPADEKYHFEQHIKRVGVLGLALYDAHPELYGSLSRDLVKDFLALHDRTKVDDSPAFRKAFWRGVHSDRSFNERLEELYHNPPQTDADRQKLDTTRDDLNRVDHHLGYLFFKLHKMLDDKGEPGPAAKLLLHLDRIADVTDRHIDPVAGEELGITDEPLLSKFLPEATDRALVKELAAKYEKLVGHLAFRPGLRCYRNLERLLGPRANPPPKKAD